MGPRDSAPASGVSLHAPSHSSLEEPLSSATLPHARYPDSVEPAAAVVVTKPGPRSADWRLVLCGVLIAGAAYVWWDLGRGWMPFDDGTLAQSAERVMQGQLPHRDFNDVYT